MTKLSRLAIVLILITISNLLLSQNFEGKIIYDLSFEKPEDTPAKTFEMMFRDTDDQSTANYYLKNDYYRIDLINSKVKICHAF